MKNKNWWILVALILGIFGFLLLVYSLFWIPYSDGIFDWSSKVKLDNASKFGSFISGIVGVFWSGAAGILIYATFHEQKKWTQRQQFESVFFQMLNTLMNMINTTKGIIDIYNRDKKDYEGLEYYSMILEKIINIHWYEFYKPDDKIKNDERALIEYKYELVYEDYQNKLGHFYRLVYNLFKFSIENKGSIDERKYINLIQAHLSNDILGLLFYNALTSYSHTASGKARFHSWLDTYQFFQNIDRKSIISEKHTQYYPKTKFKINGAINEKAN